MWAKSQTAILCKLWYILTSWDMKLTHIPLLLLFNIHNRDHLQIQTDSEISRFYICNKTDLSHTKPLENLFLIMTSLILIEIMNSKTGTMLTAIWHLKQAVPHLNPVYEHNEILMTLSVIWIVWKNKVNS